MSGTLEKTDVVAGDILCPPHVRPMTREEFERAGELEIFRPGERLELIGGEVVRKVTPQQSAHATGIRLIDEALRKAFPKGHDVRVQLQLALGPHSEPEPDVCVVVGSARDYERQHPRGAVLVVEVADTTVRYDRTVKAGLYARAGIEDYWLLNLPERDLEIHRDPGPVAEQPFGYHYGSVTRHPDSAVVRPLAAPEAAIAVADLLPRHAPQR